MNWRVAALVLIGVVAALAATVLMFSLQANTRVHRASGQEVEILVASEDLPLMTVMEPAHIAARKVPADQARDGLRDAVQVVSKTLGMPMIKGQPFKAECFASRPDVYNLASALKAGQRVVTLRLDPQEAGQNILYPGAMVDVLAVMEMPAQRPGEPGEVVSVTLLQKVPVLAVDDQTIVSQAKGQVTPQPAQDNGNPSRKVLVSLRVTPKDAELLQLAQREGKVSLSMRSPTDTQPDEGQGILMSQLAKLYRQPMPVIPAAARAEAPAAAPKADQPARWQTVIYRAGQTEVQTFPMPAEQ